MKKKRIRNHGKKLKGLERIGSIYDGHLPGFNILGGCPLRFNILLLSSSKVRQLSHEISRGACKLAWTLIDIKKKKKGTPSQLPSQNKTETFHYIKVDTVLKINIPSIEEVEKRISDG